MSFLDSVLKVFVGDKSKKDVGALQPLVQQIVALSSEYEKLSLDELRGKTAYFKNQLSEALKDIKEKSLKLQEQADATEDID